MDPIKRRYAIIYLSSLAAIIFIAVFLFVFLSAVSAMMWNILFAWGLGSPEVGFKGGALIFVLLSIVGAIVWNVYQRYK